MLPWFGPAACKRLCAACVASRQSRRSQVYLPKGQRADARVVLVGVHVARVADVEAILEAIDVGLEDGFALAEAALDRKRLERHEIMEALVATMEVVVISAEQDSVNGPGCCAPEQLEALADALVEAKGVAIPGEEELLNCATRLLEFELKRSEAVRTLNVRLRQHAQEMDARSSVSSARYW
eukprot:g16089.t1